MKRSQINQILQSAQAFFTQHQFHLPPWASWTEADWQGQGDACREVIDCQLGWDITDFGSGDFAKRGLTLFTVRNGKAGSSWQDLRREDHGRRRWPGDAAALPFPEGRRHHQPGRRQAVLQLWNSDGQGEKADTPVSVSIDGVRRTLEAGAVVSLAPGESICLTRGLYHRFWGEGKVLVGEVSQVNDDFSDNRFYEDVGRFPSIDEDEAPWRLLVSDYAEKIR